MSAIKPNFTPIYIMSGVMGAITLAGLIFPRGPNAPVFRTCIALSAVCTYLFWLIVHMSQMNPIMCPKLTNHSYAWLVYKWGKNTT